MNHSPTLEQRLRELESECARLRSENVELRSLLRLPAVDPIQRPWPLDGSAPDPEARVTRQSPAHEKIALYRSLFRGREDVYAKRWQSRDGKAGYSPACKNEWVPDVCLKPHGKCSNCIYLPVTDQVVREHLSGKQTVGLYPLLKDETCWFLAVDFDKAVWRDDVQAFLTTCDEMEIPAYLERSRSGNGGHVWLFFDAPIPAAEARALGAAVLTRTMQRRHELGLDSYDRLFPNQDTMPKGGFGNLIALPLQKAPRDRGNSVFLDRDFEPHPDRWAFLATVRRMPANSVTSLVDQAALTDSIIGVRVSRDEEDANDDPWTAPPSGQRSDAPVPGPFPPSVGVVQSDLLYVPKDGLPSALVNRIIRLAAFQNPEFYQAQRMRMSTYGKPRVIGCAEDFPRHVGLPRGCIDELLALLTAHSINVELVDERNPGATIDLEFQGRLTPLQQEAARALVAHDAGVLSATTAFGKTVVASWLIAERRVNTLVLVHRRQLLDQWRERLATFLGIPKKEIGQIGGGKATPTGLVDVGVIQSLSHKGIVKEIVADYGQVIVDECHHLSAFSFELLLKKAKARYVVGLTATPVRNDGHHPIIMMQCGPIRFRVGAKQQAAARPFEHIVLPRRTEFRLAADAGDVTIQEIYSALGEDRERNGLIVTDTLRALDAGRSPLILTERTQHAEQLAAYLTDDSRHVILLRGGMGVKQRRAVAERLAGIPDDEPRVIIATGSYIGEGFDDARLDTLLLTMPVSWRGTVQQYAGRLHRLHQQKRVVQVYDYLDGHIAMLQRMYQKRLKGYKALGYVVHDDGFTRTEGRHGYQPNLWSKDFVG